ncbi:aromatic amino acid transaminase [Marinibactrum halimedae]|uniref:Aminotransferase n=1 Tax=Marinibactrum halimedae TaxID=1444977 RepID=A0AA37T5V1_9GAMM|nr:amino acid aminotransferase [Marinibactrum halimedae]MCD9457894.1 aspartate/tyrosine/aromatic aminotransferase [Marinibactrum halimedae]GLS26281.1 aminotransferase [Marinibactrum halimedae]
MFNQLDTLAADPILGLMAAYQQDTHPQKLDLGIGVYKNEEGLTPVLESVSEGQNRHIALENTKSYLNPAGYPGFNEAMQTLIFGEAHPALMSHRVATVQTPGGCGALRVAAELIKRAMADVTIWVSDPTWANHIPLLGDAGLSIKTYPYYDPKNKGVRFEDMLEVLAQLGTDDIVLLHGCCHNPCGADLSKEQWQTLAGLALERGFVPFIDMAYQGFGDGLEDDAYGLRLLSEQLPEVIVATSCSKNFGLYRERTGCISFVCESEKAMKATKSQLLSVARGIYSMPPAHGAAIVEAILNHSTLREQWIQEVDGMRKRMQGLRSAFSKGMAIRGHDNFSFIENEKGMFSFLGLTPQQVEALRVRYSIYMINSSRVNIAGISSVNIDYLCDSVSEVLE